VQCIPAAAVVLAGIAVSARLVTLGIIYFWCFMWHRALSFHSAHRKSFSLFWVVACLGERLRLLQMSVETKFDRRLRVDLIKEMRLYVADVGLAT
jgi:hypothetical protein